MEYSRTRYLREQNVRLRRSLIIILIAFLISLVYNIYLSIQLERLDEATRELIKSVDEYIETVEKHSQVTRGNYLRSKVVQAVKETEASENELIEPIEFEVTGYCPCEKCCGKTDGITKSGVKAISSKTIAMDKKYPMGTEVIIEGFENIVFEKQDIGGAIKGNKIDIYFDTHQEALNFGRQTKKVWILTPEALQLAQLNNNY